MRAKTLAALADAASKPSLPRPHAELASSRGSFRPEASSSLTPCTPQTDGPSMASSSARGRPETLRRDVRCRFERSENARQRPSPSRTRIARPKMDVPGGALLAQARRSRATALSGVSTMNPRQKYAVCSKSANVTPCICRLLGYFSGTPPLSLTESKGCLTFHHAQLPGGSWET
jgi:hypothetical protein